MNRRLRAAALLSAALMTACSAGTHPSASTLVKTDLKVMTPAAKTEVDKVTWNVFEGEPQTIDPFKSADYTPNTINANMCETLLAQTPDFAVKPNLAASFANPDPLHWVYDLRTDVTFWDGSPMTAEDVAWSLQHNLTDRTSLYNYLFTDVKGVAVTGDHQVTVTLKRPDYLFNEELASFAGVVVQKKFFLAHQQAYGTPSTGVMCTGPFAFGSWTQGQSITLTRNPHYWNPQLRPKVKTLVLTFLTDDAAITAGLLSGQIDGTYAVPPTAIPRLRDSGAGTLAAGPAPLSITLVYANPEGPMRDQTLRRALQQAIDWKGIGTKIYAGNARPIRLQTPPTVFGFAKPQLEQLSGTLPEPQSAQYEAAKKLVPHPPAQPITMVVPDSADTKQLGLAVKDAANRIGLNFQLKVVPQTGYSNYLYDPKTRAGIDILYTQFWPNVPNPMDWLASTAVSGAIFNQYGYSGVDDLFAKARSTADPSARAELLTRVETTLHDELLPMVPGLLLDNTVWMNKRITGAPAAFDYVFYPWAAHLGGAG
ncbi:ABC transporter substrate-binding protein [Nonomuraea sediminis]|uniref:ABC transporter substrate-binding protein n=1 Tax=Nonomuraea sediminis TaxID=2835864 RepID=UPI001BDC2312|nr:ABC transporter substrate-binding protein [Nonomuraea sediminis]